MKRPYRAALLSLLLVAAAALSCQPPPDVPSVQPPLSPTSESVRPTEAQNFTITEMPLAPTIDGATMFPTLTATATITPTATATGTALWFTPTRVVTETVAAWPGKGNGGRFP